ncbi:MAG: hypothetical protein D6730_01585, partial [Bacteroidetes bacterium]
MLKGGAKAAKSGTPIGLVVTAVLLLLTAIISLLVFQQLVKGVRYKKKGPILYGLVFGLLFALMGLAGMADKSDPQPLFWYLLLGFLALGCIHTWLMYLLHAAWSKRDSFWPEAFFTLFVGCLGAFFFVVLFYIFDKQGYPMTYDLALLAFPLPFLLVKAYHQWMDIPWREFVGWKYPQHIQPNLRAYDADRLSSYLLINLIVSEASIDNSFPRKVLVKVGPNYELGNFFHVWVHEQKASGDGYHIKYLTHDEEGNPISWLFYIKPKAWWQFRRYLDPEKSFEANRIQDADTIVALRVVGDTFNARAIKPIREYEGSGPAH